MNEFVFGDEGRLCAPYNQTNQRKDVLRRKIAQYIFAAVASGIWVFSMPAMSWSTAIAQEQLISSSDDPPYIRAFLAGPNYAAKVDRVRAFSSALDLIVLSIALAQDNGDPVLERQLRITGEGDALVGQNEVQADDPHMFAATDEPETVESEGLAAIEAIADGGADTVGIPRPTAVPQALAYGRATTPATTFAPETPASEREQDCLARGIYFEARGESYRGQVAVAQTIMNRVAHPNYPDSICGVVYQNQHRHNACQFSFACDGIPDSINEPAAWAKAKEITQAVLDAEIYLTEVADATHYHATYVHPRWANNMDKITQVGLHIFYRFKPGWQFG